MLITDEYKQTMAMLHATDKRFSAEGGKYAEHILMLASQMNTTDVLDYGCGKSNLANNLPFPIKQYDPAVKKYEALPSTAALVSCTDVLEHIEPECLDAVLDHLCGLVLDTGFFVISIIPAIKILPDGRNAHISLLTPTEWFTKLSSRMHILQYENNNRDLTIIVKHKVITC